MAKCRLQHLKGRLQRDLVLLDKYKAFIDNPLEKGYSREVPPDKKYSKGKWFLPHHLVFHAKKPEKTCVVFDCSARYQDISLNSYPSQRPDWTNTLVGVLTRFRVEPMAVIADIEGIFLQVKVPVEDANSLQFLWWPDGDLQSKPKEYQMLIHLFGATSSPSCASFALFQTAKIKMMI